LLLTCIFLFTRFLFLFDINVNAQEKANNLYSDDYVNVKFPLSNISIQNRRTSAEEDLIETNDDSLFGRPTIQKSRFSQAVTLNECFSQMVHFEFTTNQFDDSIKYDSARWNFGDTASGPLNYATSFFASHLYPSSGTYYFTLILYRGNFSDTGSGSVTLNPLVNLGNDTAICEGDVLRLALNVYDGSFTWSTGSTKNYIDVTDAGTYWINVCQGRVQRMIPLMFY